jgi:inorganic phosphate transporter, PiT family
MTAELSLPLLIGLIAVALAFDFLNGLHDTANSIATLVSTRMLRPRYAVIWAAFFNFIAFLVFGVHVARTVGVGIVSADVIDPDVILGALMGAIFWNLLTWWAGIPSSSSHALIGGLIGAGVIKAGLSSIVWPGLVVTGAFIVLSPLFGFLLALLLILAVSWAFVRANPRSVEPTFQWLQFAAASLISLGHGGNDAQKTMGIIAVLLFSQGHLGSDFYVPFWVVLICQATIALGTLAVGAGFGAGTGLVVAGPVGAVVGGVVGAIWGRPFWGPPNSPRACWIDNSFYRHCRYYAGRWHYY